MVLSALSNDLLSHLMSMLDSVCRVLGRVYMTRSDPRMVCLGESVTGGLYFFGQCAVVPVANMRVSVFKNSEYHRKCTFKLAFLHFFSLLILCRLRDPKRFQHCSIGRI